jgi:hypothetical protein
MPGKTEELDKILNSDPAGTAFKNTLYVTVGVTIVIGLFLHLASQQARLAFLFMSVPLCLLYAVVICTVIYLTYRANEQRSRAVEAVNRGLIAPTWGKIGRLFSGILLVDEPNKKIFINGRIMPAGELRSVSWNFRLSRSGRFIFFIEMNVGGQKPIVRLEIGSENECENTATRLSNFVGLT